MKTGIRLLAAAISGAVLLSLAGCGNTTWVMKNEDDVITSGVYLGYLLQGYDEAASSVSDANDNFWKSTVEDKNAVDWVRDYAQKYAKEDLAIKAKAREYGIALDDTDESQLDMMLSYYWSSYEEHYEENGVGESSFRALLYTSSLHDKLFQYYYGEDGVAPVSEEELFGYLDEEYIKYKSIELSILDDEGNDLSDEEKAAVREKAEGYLARLQAGEEIDTLINEYALEQDSEAEETSSEDNQYYASASNRESDDLTEKLFTSAEVGVPVILETDSSYCVVLRQAMDDTDLETYYDTLLQNYKADEFEEIVVGWGEELNATVNSAAISRYNPKKLKID